MNIPEEVHMEAPKSAAEGIKAKWLQVFHFHWLDCPRRGLLRINISFILQFDSPGSPLFTTSICLQGGKEYNRATGIRMSLEGLYFSYILIFWATLVIMVNCG